jgi:2',3'-cyclic-nucleotide 2'-phosphodiesterase (5'-nucleotidase family)
MPRYTAALLLTAVLALSCGRSYLKSLASDEVGVILLQLNDLHEIGPWNNENEGGLARFATIKEDLIRQNSNTYAVVSGNFLHPTVTGSMVHEGRQIQGKDMIEVLNAASVDLATFGHHDLDLDFRHLQQRINEARFDMITANTYRVVDRDTLQFARSSGLATGPLSPYKIVFFNNADGRRLRVGFVGITSLVEEMDGVVCLDFMDAARRAIESLRNNVELIIPVTNLSLEQDKLLARTFPELPLIIGGRTGQPVSIKEGNTVIAKSGPNASSVYVHYLRYQTRRGEVQITHELIDVDDTYAPHPQVQAVVYRWMDIANRDLQMQGFDPHQVVHTLSAPLEGRQTMVYEQQTNLGQMIAAAMSTSGAVDCSFFPAGLIQLDDRLTGEISQYDVLRTLPEGGGVVLVHVRGSLLELILQAGLSNRGTRGYLQWDGIESSRGSFLIAGATLKYTGSYRVMIPEVLLEGSFKNLEFLTLDHPDLISSETPDVPENDLRKIWIQYLRAL